MPAPSAIDITRVRGDTYAETLTVTSTDVGFTLVGGAAVLTVSELADPPDDTTELFAIAGSILDATRVRFTPSAPQAATGPGVYYYDVQVTDVAGVVVTVARGRWIVLQDVTK